MTSEVLRRLAEELLAKLASVDGGLRVAVEVGGLACLVQVWPRGGAMPTAAAEAMAPGSRRAGCRADALRAVEEAGRPLTRKEVVRALKGFSKGGGHGAGTVEKALAELTAGGQLVNTRDKRGDRLPNWVTPEPTLFDGESS